MVRRAARRAGGRWRGRRAPTSSCQPDAPGVRRRFGRRCARRERRRRRRDGDGVLAALWTNVADLRAARERELVVDRTGRRDRRCRTGSSAFVPLLERDVHDLDGLRSDRWASPRHRPLTSRSVHILIATDANWIVDDIVAALGSDDTTFAICRDGRVVAGQVAANARPTSASSTSRSARWAAWRSRCRCGSTSPPACCPGSRS